jgi:hypothetical protein
MYQWWKKKGSYRGQLFFILVSITLNTQQIERFVFSSVDFLIILLQFKNMLCHVIIVRT